MVFMRFEVVGTGTPDDPFRPPLPTWDLVDIDYVNRAAIVDVPRTDIPAIYLNAGNPVRRVLKGLDVLTGLDPSVLQAWRAHLIKRYPASTAVLSNVAPA